ncbi:hypothetical protein JCM1840_003894 [Sporobolomyces johnsonii]
MSYAAAAHAAPSGPDPQPDPALLNIVQPANEHSLNQEQRHLQPSRDGELPSTVPQKREGTEEVGEGGEAKKGRKEGANGGAKAVRFQTTIEEHPAMKGLPAPEELEKKTPQPFFPRATLAVSDESPNGTQEHNWAQRHQHQTVLQQHVEFFDRDRDGIIWPLDTFMGFHDLGFMLPLCIFAVFAIHPTFSWFTLDKWLPDPLFRISVKNIHRAKHGSDTGVYDKEGRFVPARFEAIFAQHDRTGKGGLTFFEGLLMIKGNRNVLDPIGWTAAFLEWLATYILFWPQDGVVTKEDLRTVYDGSVFFAVAAKQHARRDRFPLSGIMRENKATDLGKIKRT